MIQPVRSLLMRIFILVWSLLCFLFSQSTISFHIICLFFIFLWQSFPIWDSISLPPRHVISRVDFNSIIVFLGFLQYLLIFSISLLISSYGFPVNFIFSYDLQSPLHGGVFPALHCGYQFPDIFSGCWSVSFTGVCLSSEASGWLSLSLVQWCFLLGLTLIFLLFML